MVKKIKDLASCETKKQVINESNITYIEYKNLLINAVKINGVDFIKERFIKNALIENGCVGYDRLTDKWCNVYGLGLNEMGNPTELNFVFKNGYSFTRPAYYEPDENGAYKIDALPDTFALGILIKKTTDFMQNCDVAISQNIDASKTPFVAIVKDKDYLLSLEHAIEDKQSGKPVVMVSDELGDALKSVDFGVEYVADKILTIRDIERDHLLNKLGIMSANINKKERVQVGEVNATVGQCEDYIFLLIDTFNKQMESYGLPFSMELNGSLEDLYTDETDETDETEDKNETKDGDEK